MKLKWTAALFLSASLLVPAAASASTSAEDKYPDGPIRILVGYSPSGAADIIARLFTEAFSRHLDQTVIVENRPGAGSTLASRALAQSEPDGYTLALASGTLYGIDQFLLEVDYTPQDFTPLTRLTVSPLILAVGPELGVSTVSELMDKAKASSRGLPSQQCQHPESQAPQETRLYYVGPPHLRTDRYPHNLGQRRVAGLVFRQAPVQVH